MSPTQLFRRVGRAGIATVVLIGCASALAAQRTVTKAHATAVADSLNLRNADLPGYTQVGKEAPVDSTASRLDAEFAACYKGPPYSTIYADIQSPGFRAGGASATFAVTETEIFPTAALASRDIAAAGGALGRACALSFGKAVVPPVKGTKILGTITSIASRVSGTGAAIALRLTLTEVPTSSAGPATKVIGTQDEFTFLRGQAEVGMEIGTNSAAVPSASLERRLASLESARLKAVIG